MLHRNALITLCAQAAIQLLGLATGILVARLLGPSGRGELGAIVAWVSMITYLGNLGLPVAYAYAAAREPERSRQLLFNGMLAVLIQWPTLLFLGSVTLNVVLGRQSEHTVRLASIFLCAYIPLNLLTLYANAIQQGLGWYRRFNLVRVCVPATYLVGLGAVLLLSKITVASVVWANLFSNAITLAIALILVIPLVWHRSRGQRIFDLAGLWRDSCYGLKAHIGNVQPFNGLRADILLLTLVLSAHDLGLYMAGWAAAAMIKTQGVALGMIVMPEVARRPDRNAQRRLVLAFGGIALILGSVTATVVVIWAAPLVNLVYGGAFAGAVPALRVLTLGGIVWSVYRVAADGLRGMGLPLRATTAELVSIGVGVPAILLFAPRMGSSGGAIAVALAAIAALAVTIPALFNRVPSRKKEHAPRGNSFAEAGRVASKAE